MYLFHNRDDLHYSRIELLLKCRKIVSILHFESYLVQDELERKLPSITVGPTALTHELDL